MANISKSVKLGVFTLAIMNVTAVVSLRGLPAEAEYEVGEAVVELDQFKSILATYTEPLVEVRDSL